LSKLIAVYKNQYNINNNNSMKHIFDHNIVKLMDNSYYKSTIIVSLVSLLTVE